MAWQNNTEKLLTWEKQHANKCCRENSENNMQINVVGKRAKTTCKINVVGKKRKTT